MTDETRPHLSVVIPMYNEAARITKSLHRLAAYFSDKTYSYEVVLVDDGSSDDSIAVARRELGEVPSLRVVGSDRNYGKGHAVRMGMLRAKGDYVLFTDADLSTPIEELDKFWPRFEQGFDVVIGSRKMKGAEIIRHQPWWRENMGKVFTWLTNRLVTRNLSDLTCGFKSFRRAAAQDIFSHQTLHDWSFDAEIMFIAQRRGHRIKEVAVRWHDERGTKVRIVRDTLRSIRGLIKIRLNGARGLYGRVTPTRSAQPADRRLA